MATSIHYAPCCCIPPQSSQVPAESVCPDGRSSSSHTPSMAPRICRSLFFCREATSSRTAAVVSAANTLALANYEISSRTRKLRPVTLSYKNMYQQTWRRRLFDLANLVLEQDFTRLYLTKSSIAPFRSKELSSSREYNRLPVIFFKHKTTTFSYKCGLIKIM